jgi:SpoIVB peptidase S55
VRPSSLVVAAALTGLLAPLPLCLHAGRADAAAVPPDVMPVKDIKPGMKGYGLTVFQGTKPGKFSVEVIGVLKNFLPRQDLILVKTENPRLDVAKVVAGMSGSPIYLNGKMIGAYSYGWSFGSEPVAGVTPIMSMLAEERRPLPKSIYGWPLKVLPGHATASASTAGMFGPRYTGSLNHYDLLRHARELARAHASLAPGNDAALHPLATPLLMGGMTSQGVGIARSLLSPLGLEPLQAGGAGATDPNAPKHFVDGCAIGVDLIRGDMSAMGLGTVTRVNGSELVAFGHPMMQSGVTALPTSIGRVLWFLASEMRSFKIGESVRPLGALINDRQAAIVVSEAEKAPLIDVNMKIEGVPGNPVKDWHFQVAHEPFMSPAFMAVALGNAMQDAASERQDVSWTADSALTIRGHGTIHLQDFGVAIGGTPDPQDFIRSNLVRAVGALMNNPWEDVVIERADMVIKLRFARDILRLRGAEVLDPELDAGQPARIRLTLIPYAGPAFTRTVSVPLPRHLAGQSVTLDLTPGYTEQRDQADPDSLDQLIKNLENPIYPPKSIVISYNTGAGAVSYKGHVARDLPPGGLDMIRPTSSSVAPDAFRSETRFVVPLAKFMTGQDHVTVTVKPVLR